MGKEVKREIKFRAWDKENRRMLQNVSSMLNNSSFILQQYIGIKDLKGKEIFEGDIIRGINYRGNKIIQPIIWHRSGWYAGYINDLDKDMIVDSLDSITDIRIAGNIYENPGLSSWDD